MLNRYQGVFRGEINNPGFGLLYKTHITLVDGNVNGIIGFFYAEYSKKGRRAGTLTLIDISTTSITVKYDNFFANDRTHTMVMTLLSNGQQLEVTYPSDTGNSQAIGTLDRIS